MIDQPPPPHVPGTTVVVRTVTHGQVRWASAAVAVRDDDWLAFFQAHLGPNKVTVGAAARWPNRRVREVALRAELVAGQFELVDKVPATAGSPSLTVARYDDWFSTRFRQHGGRWVPEYVNICLPYRRSRVGFDTDDLCLDLVVTAGSDGRLSWEPKDDDDLDPRCEAGIYTTAEVERIRAAGSEAGRRITTGATPFDGSWAEWRLDDRWPTADRLPEWWAEDLIALPFL